METLPFTDLLDAAERHARTTLFKKREPHLPTTWLCYDGRDTRKVLTPWRDEHERELAKVFMRTVIQQHSIVAYCCVSEVWYTRETPESYASKNFVQPRHRADRKEMVIAMATDGKSVRVKSWEMVRDWNEQVIDLKPHSEIGHGFGGWMIALLGAPTNFLE